MENKNLTAVEWLAEKYNYVTWMRNRDEISAGLADEWRKDYLEQAKEMEKEQIIEHLTWFQSYLNGKGLITDHDWDFEKLAKQYIKKECK